MESSEYASMFRHEDSHWWYRALDDFLEKAINIAGVRNGARVLDAGCGTGRVLSNLAKRFSCIGVDYSELAVDFCRQRGLNELHQGSVMALPIDDATVDAVVSMDVLYHKAVDDVAALREFGRVLKPAGQVFLIWQRWSCCVVTTTM